MSGERHLVCLTILSYKRPEISEQSYRDYMLNTHAPLVSKLLEKYGSHNSSITRPLTDALHDEQFIHTADYHSVVQFILPDIECFAKMQHDPFYVENIKPDHERFADTEKSK
ncbi:hypothetical protein IFM47457_03700 [Aspergillus lentulus]|nr:hypothetical protein IFM47457_03700 [Aspergillus lentulus]